MHFLYPPGSGLSAEHQKIFEGIHQVCKYTIEFYFQFLIKNRMCNESVVTHVLFRYYRDKKLNYNTHILTICS